MNKTAFFPFIIFLLSCSFPLLAVTNQVVIDNFDDGTWTTLYGGGEIGLLSDKDEAIPGSTVLTKSFDSASDHTTGSGNALKLDYDIDQYGGVYLVFTANANQHPYIDGNTFKQLSFWLRSSKTTSDWVMELKDTSNNKASVNLGTITDKWQKYEYNIQELANLFPALHIESLNTLVFINKVSGSDGALWLDDLLFDTLAYADTLATDNASSIKFSDYKINVNNQSIRIAVELKKPAYIRIKLFNKQGLSTARLLTGDFLYDKDTEHVFEWDGKDENSNFLKNGVYFIRIEIDSRDEQTQIVKPVGIFR